MSEEPSIRRETLDRLARWGGAKLQRKLIGIFLKDTPARVAQIRDGLASADSKMAEVGAHSLKSSAGNLGAHRLQELAQVAENTGAEGDVERLKEIFPELEAEYSSACQALEGILEDLEE
jgi:HPt (histidine-containing phosphotransfer) domain-containing protein